MEVHKSSISHPLQIDSLAAGKGGGNIGLTLCPGKKQMSAYSGTWNRDLHADLQIINTFGARALVTLTEDDELETVHVPVQVLSARSAEQGIKWHHLPIHDTCVPDERFEDLWTYSDLHLRTLPRSGENIVIHCKGGLGRTGTIAARLLVEMGSDPEDAIKAVRKARPG